jgi:hypothetical protein
MSQIPFFGEMRVKGYCAHCTTRRTIPSMTFVAIWERGA